MLIGAGQKIRDSLICMIYTFGFCIIYIFIFYIKLFKIRTLWRKINTETSNLSGFQTEFGIPEPFKEIDILRLTCSAASEYFTGILITLPNRSPKLPAPRTCGLSHRYKSDFTLKHDFKQRNLGALETSAETLWTKPSLQFRVAGLSGCFPHSRNVCPRFWVSDTVAG